LTHTVYIILADRILSTVALMLQCCVCLSVCCLPVYGMYCGSFIHSFISVNGAS